ncbi:MAG: DinB family protein [bacterium]
MPVDPQASHFDRDAVLARLEQSLQTIEWAVSLVPAEWTHKSPSGTKMSSDENAWSVAMNLAHLVLYTERLPSAVLRSLLDGGDGVGDTWFREPGPYEAPAVELASQPVAEILRRLRAARASEVGLALSFSESAWAAPSTRAWGQAGYGPRLHSPARILSKSQQHTWEHGNSILRVALFAPLELEGD